MFDLDRFLDALAGVDVAAAVTTSAGVIVGLLAAVFVLRALRRRRPLGELARRVKPSRADRVLTFVGAAMASGVAAYGMLLIFRHSGITHGGVQAAFVTFVEINAVGAALRSRHFRLLHAQRVADLLDADPDAEIPPRGRDVDGIAVWVIAGLSSALGLFDSGTLVEAIARIAAPLIAAFAWERGLVGELRQYATRKTSAIRWINPLEALAIRLGFATPSETARTAAAADRARRIALVVDAGYRVETVPDFRIIGAALRALADRRYYRRLRAVQTRYGLDRALLGEIRGGVAALRTARTAVSAAALAGVDPWTTPDLLPEPPAPPARPLALRATIRRPAAVPTSPAPAGAATRDEPAPAPDKRDPFVTYADAIRLVQQGVTEWKTRDDAITQGEVLKFAVNDETGKPLYTGVPTIRKIVKLIESMADRDPMGAVTWLVSNNVLTAEQAREVAPDAR